MRLDIDPAEVTALERTSAQPTPHFSAPMRWPEPQSGRSRVSVLGEPRREREAYRPVAESSTLCPGPTRLADRAQSMQAVRCKLADYRSLLEKAWSRTTIHPAYAKGYRPASPFGQCGVSSAWLVHQLNSELGISADYCYGSLRGTSDSIASHCWVELQFAEISTVIDLTSDQASAFCEPVVFEHESDLRQNGIFYESYVRMTLDELKYDSVWQRFSELAHRINATSGGLNR